MQVIKPPSRPVRLSLFCTTHPLNRDLSHHAITLQRLTTLIFTRTFHNEGLNRPSVSLRRFRGRH